MGVTALQWITQTRHLTAPVPTAPELLGLPCPKAQRLSPLEVQG